MAVTADKLRTPSAHPAEETAWFETAFDEHWPRIVAVLYRIVGERAEAEDLALETFWRLFRHPPGSGDNVAGWLYRVATNLGLNALRSRRRRGAYEQAAGELALVENQGGGSAGGLGGSPEIETERAEQRRLVRSVLARLKPRSAQLLVMRHSGLSYAEIAAALGISPASVGALLARAEREFETAYRKIAGG